jgi:hypothetical protein
MRVIGAICLAAHWANAFEDAPSGCGVEDHGGDAADKSATPSAGVPNVRNVDGFFAAGRHESGGGVTSVNHSPGIHRDYGLSVTICTRQFVISPTSNWFSLRQSRELASPNSFGNLPAEPNLPTMVPSSRTL